MRVTLRNTRPSPISAAVLAAAAAVGGLAACGDDAGAGGPNDSPSARPLFVSDPAPGCLYASPLLVETDGDGTELVLTVSQDGLIQGIDPETGAVERETRIAVDPPERVELLATPAIVGDGRYAVLAWQDLRESTRIRHRVAVFDLSDWAFSDAFSELVLAATHPTWDGERTIAFDSGFQLLRAALIPVPPRNAGDALGKVIVSLGNGPSIQPFHGWVFELDLDAWRGVSAEDDALAAARSGLLLTTAEDRCFDGHPAMTCGGGVWNAAGPRLVPGATPEEPPSLLVPTGNGRVDFDRQAYAHAVLRVGEGLRLEPGCDEASCSPFDELAPDPACLASCANVFVPRLDPGEPALVGGVGAPAFRETDRPLLEAGQRFPDCAPPSGPLSFMECYGAIDADLGANTPVVVDDPRGEGRLLVQAGKDGALYLIDGETLGVQYERLQLMPFCGTENDPCIAFWAGTLVTEPVATEVDGTPVVVLPAFIADRTHPAGIHAVDIVVGEDGDPTFRPRWQVPDPASSAAVAAFRHHPGRPVLVELDGETHVAVLEVERDRNRGPGTLWVVRIRDGAVVIRQPITDGGNRYVRPLLRGPDLYLNTCDKDGATRGRLLGFRLE